MIPSLRETVNGLYGALRLLRGNEDGLTFFDASDEGFWKSFFAAVLTSPAFFTFAYLDPRPIEASGLEFFLVETISFVIVWTAFPLAMFHIARLTDRSQYYRLHIVAYNWSQVVQTLVAGPLLLGLRDNTYVPEGAAQLLGLVVMIGLGVYEWFIARSALKLPGSGAVAVVMLSFMLVLVMNDVSYSLLR